MNFLTAIAAVAFAFPGSTPHDESHNFARSYKAGEKANYTLAMTSSIGGTEGGVTVDLTLITTTVGADGAHILVHMSNQKATGSVTPETLPADKNLRMVAHNMPDHFETSGIDQFELIFMLASSTLGKTVKVGDEVPWSWEGGKTAYSYKVTTKILEISAEKKTLKALIKGKVIVDGHEFFDVSFTSIFDTSDNNLVESTGEFASQGKTAATFKFAKKK